MHCGDENDDDNGDDDDDCNGDDNCDDDDDDGLNLHRGSACSSLNKTTQSRKEESHLLIAVCKPIQNTKKVPFHLYLYLLSLSGILSILYLLFCVANLYLFQHAT